MVITTRKFLITLAIITFICLTLNGAILRHETKVHFPQTVGEK